MKILFTGILTGVDVDDTERLRGFDDEITAGFQPDPFSERLIHGFFHLEKLEQRQQGIVIERKLLKIFRLKRFQINLYGLVDIGRIRHHG